MSTGRAHPQPSLGGPRLGPVAGGAHELLPPAEPRQVLAARLLGREARFELPERARVVLHSLNHYRLGLLESRTYPKVVKIAFSQVIERDPFLLRSDEPSAPEFLDALLQ